MDNEQASLAPRPPLYLISVNLIVRGIVNRISDKPLAPLISRWIASDFRPEERRTQRLGSKIALLRRGFAGRTHGDTSP
ncbi:MAG: hypothetical protein JNL14_02260 [Devosia sp.]|uniref:hypothetical protein n=1 Tax=Devosia sp. TaxID=1871048 RepID=UPI001A4185B4|nr:hypothetical protein [Devosia sp.]MBL8596543.1 hypothetical protein [Devosia sp.]